MFQARKSVHMVFTIGPRSILPEFSLSNSMETLRGLERASRPAPKADKPLTKKAVKNLKHNKHRSDKRHAKTAAPKLAPSLALELAKTTLRRAFQQRSSSTAYPSMARPFNWVLTPCPTKFHLDGEPSQRNHQKPERESNQGKLGSLIWPQGKFGSLLWPRGKIEFLPPANPHLGSCIYQEWGKNKQKTPNLKDPQ